MKKHLLLILVLLGWAGATIIPSDRVVDWSYVGVPGGIPSRTTIYMKIDSATYGKGTVDASTAIATAIKNCPANQVVYLPSGTYRVDHAIDFSKSNVTLRGAGMGSTKILGQIAGGGFGIISTQEVGLSDTHVITNGYTKGSTRITVDNAAGANAGSVDVGSILVLLEANDSDITWSDVNRQDLVQQRVIVTAVSGDTIDFSPALVYTFKASLNPRWVHTLTAGGGVRSSGIEDLTLEAGASNTTPENLFLFCTYGFWVKNVKSINASNVHFECFNGLRDEIRECFFYKFSSNRDGGGIQLASTGNNGGIVNNCGYLIENNLADSIGWFIMADGAIGSVISYNYIAHVVAKFDSPTEWPHQTPAFFSNHGAHGMMNLWEGNIGEQFQSDGYHGSSSHHTVFRNWFNGIVLDTSIHYNLKMIALCRYTYYYNIVGNVLGSTSWPVNGVRNMDCNGCWYDIQPCIYQIGYPNSTNNIYSTTNPPSNANNGGFDTKVRTTTLFHGNYDYDTLTTEWDPAIEDHSLPASLYLNSKPVWFGALPWPPIGPDLTPMTGTIPAKQRFLGVSTVNHKTIGILYR